jgi:HSP20 family protein
MHIQRFTMGISLPPYNSTPLEVYRVTPNFRCSSRLPEDANGSKVSAEYKEGVLKVHLPKSEKAKPKSIEVKVS